MRKMIGIFQNHDFSQRMFAKHGETGHFAPFLFHSLDEKLRELNIGKRIKGKSRERAGHLTRPLCNSCHWRPTSLFEITDARNVGDQLLRFVRRQGKTPIGIKYVKQSLDLDDRIRFPEAKPMPIVVHGIHHVLVPKSPSQASSRFLGKAWMVKERKESLDNFIIDLFRQNKIEHSQHF